jgi:hypothetical protein
VPLYTIVRDVSGWADSDIDAAGVRAVICSYSYSEMRWIRSYLDRERGELLCLYEARNVEELREHAARSRIPAGEIRLVEEITSEPFFAAAGPPPGNG